MVREEAGEGAAVLRARWSVRSLCMQFGNGEPLKSLEQGRKVIRGSEEG